MLDAAYLCSDGLPGLQSEANRSVRALDTYIKTLERFISDEREGELSVLKEEYDGLPASTAKDQFWNDNYPVHWDDIFASQLRSSFVVALMSLAEWHVWFIDKLVCEVVSPPYRYQERADLEYRRKELQASAGFARPDEASWSALYEIRDVRNCIVHALGEIGGGKEIGGPKAKRLRQLVQRLPGLSASRPFGDAVPDGGPLELSKEFPEHALKVAATFLDTLYKEALDVCGRAVGPTQPSPNP